MERCLVPDWLHSLSFGVFQFYIQLELHSLFSVNAFQVPGPRDSRIDLSILRIRQELFCSEARAGRQRNQVQDFRRIMVGDDSSHPLGLHGAETNSFLVFTVTVLLESYGAAVPTFQLLRAAGRALLRILELLEESAEVFPAVAIQDSFP